MPKRRRVGPPHTYNPKSDPRNIEKMRDRMWKKGQSGNPKGPPKRKSLEAIIEEMLDETIGRGRDAITRRDALATVVIDEIINKRNVSMIKDVLQRLWPIVQKVDVNAKGQVTVVFDDQDRREMEQIVGEDLEPGDEEDEP